MEFNIFKILSKDDKELIHSSFLKYLLDHWGSYFYQSLFNLDSINFETPKLESGYRGKRIDIEIRSKDDKEIILIENKFKSFPYEIQLLNYDAILEEKHKDKIHHKYLICFDTSTTSGINKKDWKIISYQEILEQLKKFLSLKNEIPPEERTFIKHYVLFLEEYFETYYSKLLCLEDLIKNSSKKQNKFYVRLFNSKLRNILERRFLDIGEEVKFLVNPGNTSTPLISIIPKIWTKNGIEKLIQFQGNEIKFYVHTADKDYIRELISLTKNNLDLSNGKLKRITKRKENSCYIYKETLTTNCSCKTIEDVADYLMKFYERLDQILMRT
ncbi:PD-(D/E)XK nuclease family protein [Flavobacteriaceae bacterium KMM 6898]|nr:PD-(D/E)XK nuclease family protein [Flavobacteriaceae bacterium KMM 6898]